MTYRLISISSLISCQCIFSRAPNNFTSNPSLHFRSTASNLPPRVQIGVAARPVRVLTPFHDTPSPARYTATVPARRLTHATHRVK